MGPFCDDAWVAKTRWIIVVLYDPENAAMITQPAPLHV
jgi:hypothetical protein